MRFTELHIRLRFACAKRRCEHVASPPYLRSVLPGCHLQSIWYRSYRKTVAALDCRMSPTTSSLMLEPSGGVLLELGRCSLLVTTGHPSPFEQCSLSAPKEKLLRTTHRSAKSRNLALTCYRRFGPLMSRRNEHVADTAYGANGIGVSRIKFYLSAQACNP